MSIPDIFAAEGEDGFREVETAVLGEVSAYKKCVVATGGGAVKRQENWMHLRNGLVVCLSGDPALLAKRIAKDGVEARPLFADAEKLYAEADLRVKLLMDDDTGEEGEDLDGLCKRVLACLKRRIEEDDTKSRLKNEPKEGDITVSGM